MCIGLRVRNTRKFQEGKGTENRKATRPDSRTLFCFIHIFNHSSYFKVESKTVSPSTGTDSPDWSRIGPLRFYSKFLEKRIQLRSRFSKEFPLSKQLKTEVSLGSFHACFGKPTCFCYLTLCPYKLRDSLLWTKWSGKGILVCYAQIPKGIFFFLQTCDNLWQMPFEFY